MFTDCRKGCTSLLLGVVFAATGVACKGIVSGTLKQNRGATTDVGAEAPEVIAAFSPAAPALPRLTSAQYRAVIRDLFGSGITVPELEPDQRLYSFSVIGASTTTVSERGVDLYSEAAFSIARSVFSDKTLRTNVVRCAPATPLDDACLTTFLTEFGARVFRRPLQSAEVERYKTVATTVGVTEPWLALEYVTAALLQSPSFLYRVELGEPDREKPGWRRYTGYEMASRISFLLRNSLPDDALLAAAERGDLLTKEGVVEQATRLLWNTDATASMLDELYSEYLDLALLDDVVFPGDMDPNHTLAESMRGEVLELVNRVALRESGDMRSLFTTEATTTNADLAPLYGLTPRTSTALLSDELPVDGPRAGILTTGALLTLNNRPNRTSPTIRGLFIRQRLLCGSVPAPPPGLPPIPEDTGGIPKTIREKLEQHRSDPACAACHESMDPLGLGMEDFDQFGRYRTRYEQGQPVDATGDLDGTPFTGARELGELLSQDPLVTSCWVKYLYRYGSARLEKQSEAAVLKSLDEAFAAGGYALKPLLLALVTSDGFRFTKESAQ